MPTQINKSGYDQWSDFYDNYPNPTVAIDELHFPPLWKHVTQSDVLEIGCGTGRHTRKLRNQGNRVTGVDLSPGMLKVARERLGDSVTLIEADFIQIGFKPESFEVVICSLVIEHIQDLGTFFEKVRNVLKQGGVFYLSEIHPHKAADGGRANFKDPSTQQSVVLQSYPHRDEQISETAARVGLKKLLAQDVLGDESLVKLNPDWNKHLGKPLIKIWVFQK